MDDNSEIQVPERYEAILARSRAAQFQMNSDLLTGSLLRTLAASKPGAAFLELGTGAGLGTGWILAGIGRIAALVFVANEPPGVAGAPVGIGDDRPQKLVEAEWPAVLAGFTGGHD